jgi:uncharacterized integral membrane protein
VSTPDPRPAGTPGTPGTPGTDPTLGSPEGERPSPPPLRSTGPDGQASAGQTSRHPGRAIGRTLALALLTFVTVVLVLFVVFNTQTVDISLVFTDVRAPLVVALLIAAALGGLIVALLDAVLTVRGRRRNR